MAQIFDLEEDDFGNGDLFDSFLGDGDKPTPPKKPSQSKPRPQNGQGVAKKPVSQGQKRLQKPQEQRPAGGKPVQKVQPGSRPRPKTAGGSAPQQGVAKKPVQGSRPQQKPQSGMRQNASQQGVPKKPAQGNRPPQQGAPKKRPANPNAQGKPATGNKPNGQRPQSKQRKQAVPNDMMNSIEAGASQYANAPVDFDALAGQQPSKKKKNTNPQRQQQAKPQGTPQNMPTDDMWNENEVTTPKKKKKFFSVGKIVILILIIIAGLIVAKIVMNKSKDEDADQPQQEVASDGEVIVAQTLSDLQNLLANYNSESIGELLAPNAGETSYLAEEWSYANGNKLREDWIKKAAAYAKFDVSTSGTGATQPNTEGMDENSSEEDESNGDDDAFINQVVPDDSENSEDQEDLSGEEESVGQINTAAANSLAVVVADNGDVFGDLDDSSEDSMYDDSGSGDIPDSEGDDISDSQGSGDTYDTDIGGVSDESMDEIEDLSGSDSVDTPNDTDMGSNEGNTEDSGSEDLDFNEDNVKKPTTAPVDEVQPVDYVIPIENLQNISMTVPDYEAIAKAVIERTAELSEKLEIKGYSKKDYDYQNECIDLMMEDLLSITTLPTKQITINLSLQESGRIDDAAIDDALYGSDEWHDLCDVYDTILSGYTGYKTVEHKEKVEIHNKEYDKWYKLFKKYYNKDKGHFHKGKSKWEPWYKRDKHNRILRDKKGRKIVNYYSVKDKNGKDWVQPAKTKWVTKLVPETVPVEYVPETAVTRCFIGANYCQNVYTGGQNAEVKVGDGSKDAPAGVRTPIITQALCDDGQYHDVRVTLNGYWVGEDAINYCMDFSESNRGLDPKAVVQYITYEVTIENLEDDTIIIPNSEMTLCDAHQNKSPRTGMMYGFTNENLEIQPHQAVVMNDWGSSTEILQKYVAWGRSFDRDKNMVYFKVLAGEGNIPPYSAYKAFTGEMYESGSNDVTPDYMPSKEPEETEAPMDSYDDGEGDLDEGEGVSEDEDADTV